MSQCLLSDDATVYLFGRFCASVVRVSMGCISAGGVRNRGRERGREGGRGRIVVVVVLVLVIGPDRRGRRSEHTRARGLPGTNGLVHFLVQLVEDLLRRRFNKLVTSWLPRVTIIGSRRPSGVTAFCCHESRTSGEQHRPIVRRRAPPVKAIPKQKQKSERLACGQGESID